jgi:hypothetical protein
VLPPPAHLRTHRAPFNAVGSSISKALLDRETRQHITAPTSRYRPGATRRFRLWAHQLDLSLPSSAFPYKSCLSGFLVTRHLLEVSNAAFAPAFAWGKSRTPIRAITTRPSLSPASFTRCAIGWSCDRPTQRERIVALPCSACLPEWVRCGCLHPTSPTPGSL